MDEDFEIYHDLSWNNWFPNVFRVFRNLQYSIQCCSNTRWNFLRQFETTTLHIYPRKTSYGKFEVSHWEIAFVIDIKIWTGTSTSGSLNSQTTFLSATGLSYGLMGEDFTSMCSICLRSRRNSFQTMLTILTRVSKKYSFEKPNDRRALDLMNTAATGMMKEMPDVILGYGMSDEYRYVSLYLNVIDFTK